MIVALGPQLLLDSELPGGFEEPNGTEIFYT